MQQGTIKNPNMGLSFFANDVADPARLAAIDQLHLSTAIYTQGALVEQLLSRLGWPDQGRTLVDPSAGNGEFLYHALVKLLTATDAGDADIVVRIQGYEIHPHACAEARARLATALVQFGRSAISAERLAQSLVHNKDFLTDGPTEPSWDIVAGNPPYLRWLNVPALLRGDYEAHVPPYARADLLHSFLDRCAAVLRSGGEIGLITADRWLSSQGASQLRTSLGKTLTIRHIERLDVETAFYRPKQRRKGTAPRISPVSVVLGRGAGIPLSKQPIYPGFNPAPYAGQPTLGSLATVRLAPWLGPIGIFLITEAEALESAIPSAELVPAIDAADISGHVMGQPTRFAILTYPDRRPSDAVVAHLERTMSRMPASWRRENTLLPPERFHKLDLTTESLLVPRIANSTRATRIPPNVLPTDHHLSIVCDDPVLLARIEAALASEAASTWMRGHAAPLENQYFAVTAPLLRQLPIAL